VSGQFFAAVRRASVRVCNRRVTGASGQAPRGAEPDVEPIGRAARPVTCDRTCPVTCDRTCPVVVGALWTPTGRRVQRVRSNAEARPVTATVTSDAHCFHLSCSDRTRLVSTFCTASSGNG
jgi:hypothetical protein